MKASSGTRSVGLGRRLAAGAYDLLLVIALWMLISALFLPLNGGAAPQPGSLLFQFHRLTLLLATGLFYVCFWRFGGQTLGMRAWRIQLIRDDGDTPTVSDCSKRLLGAVISLLSLGLGFSAALFNSERRTWHDRWSKTHLQRSA